jgi:transposase
MKNVPGRKTDKIDSEWICKLLLAGLLKASFIPEEKIRQLRDVNRYATKLTAQLASEKNRIQKVLEDANIKLSSVLSDITGVVAIRLIDGLIAGRTDLAALIEESYHGRLKASKSKLLEAITGRLTGHHRFMLEQFKSHITYLESQLALLERQMDSLLADHILEVELLCTIPGVNKTVATKILAEVGLKVEETFGNPKRLAKWAGICPGNNESGGKKLSGRTTHGNKYLKSILAEAGWAATRTKGTYLRAKYDSMVGRKGKKKALLVLGHKILCASYHILSTLQPYESFSVETFEARRNQRRITYLQRELQELGV